MAPPRVFRTGFQKGSACSCRKLNATPALVNGLHGFQYVHLGHGSQVLYHAVHEVRTSAHAHLLVEACSFEPSHLRDPALRGVVLIAGLEIGQGSANPL